MNSVFALAFVAIIAFCGGLTAPACVCDRRECEIINEIDCPGLGIVVWDPCKYGELKIGFGGEQLQQVKKAIEKTSVNFTNEKNKEMTVGSRAKVTAKQFIEIKELLQGVPLIKKKLIAPKRIVKKY